MFFAASMAHAADTVTEYLLDTVDSGDGSWPCLFYELNYNTDLSPAEKAKWYGTDEDETYWRDGVGPFSNSNDRFLVTHWASAVHPILIRRHFTLTEEDLEKINVGTVTFTYSYDENPKFYINGTSLTSTTGWNDDNYATLRFTTARKRLLKEGDNVICVSLQQGAGGGHIDFGLFVEYDPTETGISDVQADSEDDPTAFNLMGQRIAHPQQHHGIVITGKGKKILNKQ